jgi:PAS domain S-box-containing protein
MSDFAPAPELPPSPGSPPQLATLIDACDAAIISKSLDNIILSWNRAAEQMYGYTAEEAIGKAIGMLAPPERRHEADEIVTRIARGERIEHLETVRMRRDGAQIDVDLIISPLRNAEGRITGALTLARDITSTRQAEAELHRLQQHAAERLLVLETANRVAVDILASRTGLEALRHIADAARTLSRARYSALGVANPNGAGLMEFVTTGLSPAEEAAIGPRPQGAGVLGMLLKRTAPLRLDHLADHPSSSGFPPNHPPMRTFLGVPIRRGETVVGSLYLTDKEDGLPFTEADEIAVQALGAHAAVAIHNLHLLARQRALVSGLIAAQEEERRAVAYDLHDGLTQFVMASHAHLEAFQRAQETGKTEKANRELDYGLRYLKDAVVESRRLVNGLRSLALDDLGLAGALEQLLVEEKTRAGWEEADFLHNISGRRYLKALETTIYRVAQEALTNARKHAHTDRVRLLLLAEEAEGGGPQLTLEVRDWGKGFVPEEHVGDYGHVGLHSMMERVSLIGGTSQLQSAPGEGAVMHAVFPALEPGEEEGSRE